MSKVPFTKMSGSGNDFILIDHRTQYLSNYSLPHLAQALCRRRESIGADGLILVEDSSSADFKWRFFNADGSQAEMCGNGGRCVSRFAYEKGIAGAKHSFETIAGIIRAEVQKSRVKIQLPLPYNLVCNFRIEVDGTPLDLHNINTGVPHTVVLVDDLEHAPVNELGKRIRYHHAFLPAGTNVNFVTLMNNNSLSIRTYERGVEGETLACGTGSVAAALIASALDKVTSPVKIATRSGEILTVSFKKDDASSFREVFLEGDTYLVYEGIIGDDVFRLYERILNSSLKEP